MKTIWNGTDYKRVSDQDAAVATRSGWQYCGKQAWKKAVRDKSQQKRK